MDRVSPFRTEADLSARVAELAAEISRDYNGRTVDLVYMLNGASVFCADLVRRLTVPARIHPFGFTSYAKGNTTGEVRVTLDVTEPLQGRDVIVVEGIIVSGRTPRFVLDLLEHRGPASTALCAVGIKKKHLAVDLPIRYAGYELEDELIVGYGIGEGIEKALPYLGVRAAG